MKVQTNREGWGEGDQIAHLRDGEEEPLVLLQALYRIGLALGSLSTLLTPSFCRKTCSVLAKSFLSTRSWTAGCITLPFWQLSPVTATGKDGEGSAGHAVQSHCSLPPPTASRGGRASNGIQIYKLQLVVLPSRTALL